MEQLQTKIEVLHATMEDESLYQSDRSEELTKLLKDEAVAKKRLEELEERWLMLEEEISEITARYE
ncbi:MAG: hypothetical protein R3219_09405, partial [Hydrogenovibrio sp.]|nr:hypothetical protein [Hydrogenovibrio sp.]